MTSYRKSMNYFWKLVTSKHIVMINRKVTVVCDTDGSFVNKTTTYKDDRSKFTIPSKIDQELTLIFMFQFFTDQ